MLRCRPTAKALTALAALALLLPPAARAQFATSSSSTARVPMQLDRALPPASLRGEIVFTQPPEVLLNGKPARLAPGGRIRGQNNLLVMWNAALGQKAKVNYTLDSYGLLMDVWVLRPDEIAERWPKTREEADAWRYDPISRTWSKS